MLLLCKIISYIYTPRTASEITILIKNKDASVVKKAMPNKTELVKKPHNIADMIIEANAAMIVPIYFSFVLHDFVMSLFSVFL